MPSETTFASGFAHRLTAGNCGWGAATHDGGIAFRRRVFGFTHVVHSEIDEERSRIILDLVATGMVDEVSLFARALAVLSIRRMPPATILRPTADSHSLNCGPATQLQAEVQQILNGRRQLGVQFMAVRGR